MGLAWLSSTALMALLGWRGRHVSRGLALLIALGPAWLFMAVALQSVDDGLEVLRLRLRGFEVLSREGADFRLADTDTDVPQDLPAIAIDRVSGFNQPVDVHVDRIVMRTATTSTDLGEQPSFSVRLSYPDELDVFVGLDHPNHPFPYNGIYELAHGDTITVCPELSRCEKRVIRIEKRRGRWFLGPCALSSWMGGEMQDSTRTFALLDLYHYESDRCTPRRVTDETSLWVHEVGGDRPTEDDVASFFLYQGGRVFFAHLDPDEMVETSFTANRPSEAVAVRKSVGDPVRIKMMWRDRRFLKDRVYDDPSIDQPLCGYADTDKETDYSGQKLCKRIRVYLPETELQVSLSDNIRVGLPSDEAPAVSLSCSNPPLELDPLSSTRERCDAGPLAAAYASNTRFRPPGVAQVSFPVRLVAGEPISEILRVEKGRDCGELGSPCLVAKGRAQERAYPLGAIAALGSGDTERHLVDATFFDNVRWLWIFLVAASIQILLIFGLRPTVSGRTSVYPAAIVGAALLLLTIRLLFAYKVVALFPHDQEAMDLAVSTLVIVPGLLAAIAWPAHTKTESPYRSSLWPLDAEWLAGVRAAAVGAVVLLLAARLNIISPPGRLLTIGWVLGLLATSIIASGLLKDAGANLRAFFTSIRRALPIPGLREDGPGEGAPEAEASPTPPVVPDRVVWAVLGLLLLVRGLLAIYGREALGGVRVLLWFLPLCFLLTGFVLARLQHTPRRAMVATVAIACVAFIAQWTDKGAGVIVCVPIVAVGLFLSARGLQETPASRVIFIVMVLAGVGVGCLWTWSRITEASLPPVRDGPTGWTKLSQNDGGRNLLCPTDPRTENGAIDLEPYAPLFDLSNTEVRLREFLVPGAATRIGTRESTRVAESLAIMRRYAAGKETSFWGSGFLSAPVREYGRHELRALLSDGVSSVLVASEGGTAGMLGLMGLYLVLLWLALRHAGMLSDRDGIAFLPAWPGLVAVFSLGWMTWFMCAGNIGLLLFSGQNVPFLVVQSGMDSVLPTVLFAFALSLPSMEDAG